MHTISKGQSMKTTATNKKIRALMNSIRDGTLIPNPDFQRRLVWTAKHKREFIRTILRALPFPEVYICVGEVDLNTGHGKEWLVDGQQRLSTLYEYFLGDAAFPYDLEVIPYSDLSESKKREFLEYDVVVRDLGNIPIDEVQTVFQRINSTSYSLNAMEFHNARYDNDFKGLADELAQNDFFELKKVFTANDVRRMRDTEYLLIIMTTVMSTYFNGSDEIENFLKQYNSSFEEKESIRENLLSIFTFINKCDFDSDSRIWNKTDLFTLVVEVYRVLFKENNPIKSSDVSRKLKDFYKQASVTPDQVTDETVRKYLEASRQGAGHRSNRIIRGEIIHNYLLPDSLSR